VLLVVLLVGADLVGRIPLAALAGVLMVTAVRMVERGNVLAILRASRSDALVLVGTCVTTIAFDLIKAVEVGLALAAVLALRNLAGASGVTREAVRLPAGVAPPQPDGGERVHDADLRALLAEHIVVYRLDGALFFGAAHRLLDELADVGRAEVIVLRLGFVQLLDATGAQALTDLVDDLERRGIDVLLCGVQDRHRTVLEAVAQVERLRADRRVFDDLDLAIARAHELVVDRQQ
jgi:SulP family sulfate permease